MINTIPPLNLPVSKLMSTITSLIGEVRFVETLAPSDIVNDLVASSRVGQVDFGKGIIFNYKTDLQPVKDLTETSSAFTITKPNVAQEVITIDNYKFIPISTSSILTRDAFLSGYAIDEFFAFVMSTLADTETFYMYDVCNNLLQNWVPVGAKQTVTVDQINTENLTGAELNNALKWNANEIAKTIRKTINNMKIKSTGYTDIATYTAQDGTQKPVVSALRGDELKVIFNDKYQTNIMADSLATLYHDTKVGDMIPSENFVLLPTDSMSEPNKNTIGWVGHKNKFAFADFYRVTSSIVDPSTQYENTFMHFAYGSGVFKYAPCVKLIANYIEPAQA